MGVVTILMLKILDTLVEYRVPRSYTSLFRESFTRELFPRRYIPEYTILENSDGEVDAVIDYRIVEKGFKILDYKLSLNGVDTYSVEGAIPKPYINESPYFFTLQVVSRILTRRGYLVLTDTIAFKDKHGRIHLVLGYPHDGKSSLLAIAYTRGDEILSTENTVVEVRNNKLYVLTGTRILVYDPRVHEVYGIKKIKPDTVTKHGYYILDLSKHVTNTDSYPVHDITLIHASFRSRNVEFEEISGRKILKTLWVFSVNLLRGLDYYSPYPLTLSTGLEEYIVSKLQKISVIYRGRFREAFGSHLEIYNALTSNI